METAPAHPALHRSFPRGVDSDAAMELIARSARELTGADGAAVELVEGDEMVYRAATGSEAGCVGQRLPVDGSLSGLAVRTGRLLRSDDAARDPRVAGGAVERGVRSMLVVPLRHAGRDVGALKVLSAAPRAFGDAAEATLRTLADLLSSALATAFASERAARRAEREAVLREVAHALAGAAGVDRVLRTVTERAAALTGATGAFVERVCPGEEEMAVVAASGRGAPPEGSRLPAPGSAPPDAAEGVRAHVLSPGELATHPACRDCTAIVVPLVAERLVLGTLVLLCDGEGAPVGPDSLELAEALGDLASAALARALLAEEAERRRQEAEEAVRARDHVLSVVSHDLRNPLGAVTMSVGSLLEVPEMAPETRTRQLEVALRAADRMDRLIRDLLDVTRLEAGTLAVEPAAVPADALLREAAGSLAAAVERASLALRVEAPDGLPAVRADHDRVLQVFGNLVDNAVKFTPAGGEVRLRAGPAEGAVRFSVEDTGAGIAPEGREHLFDRFWQARHGDRRGVGLGLSIVRAIVEAHGGEVEVESAPGKGTTVRFTLPAAE